MSRLAQNVDVLTHSSFEEAHCMAVNEAIAIGMPVIGGLHNGRSPWALTFRRAGLLVDVDPPTSIAQGMRAMLQKNALRRALAQAGRERALKEFHLEAVAKKYESVLENAWQEQTR
jgi:glycosyltransferase involved in cell wall biosynthesis